MTYFDVGKHALPSIIRHVSQHGVTTKTRGNKGRKSLHSATFNDVKKVVNFLLNYAGTYGLQQPAAPRGIDNLPTIYLPASKTKTEIHREYVDSCGGGRALRLTSFKDIWATCCPHIRVAKPREDVCITCETPPGDHGRCWRWEEVVNPRGDGALRAASQSGLSLSLNKIVLLMFFYLFSYLFSSNIFLIQLNKV